LIAKRVDLPPVETKARHGLLSYLEALTFSIDVDGKRISPVLVYAEPDPERPGAYRPRVAADTGYEGIACVDDTARAALLALAVYEQGKDRRALRLARRWLAFVQYMQYPDGDFANFVRNSSGQRNASGPTSVKGGPWWTARALWALARAYRITGNKVYLRAYERCKKPSVPDGKIQALLALGEIELHHAGIDGYDRQLLERADTIVHCGDAYFQDMAHTDTISVWGYHQLHAVTTIARALDKKALLRPCRKTITNLVEPIVAGRFYYQVGTAIEGETLSSPIPLYGTKHGLCAYCVTPIVQGLAEFYRATGAERYRRLAFQAAAWVYGRNDARAQLYDPSTGLCADGVDGKEVSQNRGAESSIEAGLAELERQELLRSPT
jgi:hypothetical protein